MKSDRETWDELKRLLKIEDDAKVQSVLERNRSTPEETIAVLKGAKKLAEGLSAQISTDIVKKYGRDG